MLIEPASELLAIRRPMVHSKLLTQSDAETIGWEFAQRTPDNVLDIWQRLFCQPARALSQADSPCHDRLWVINDALYQLRRLPCPYVDLSVLVTSAEAYRFVATKVFS